jgi:hypothetical protein
MTPTSLPCASAHSRAQPEMAILILNTGCEGADQGGEVPAEALRLQMISSWTTPYLSEDDLEALDVAPELGIPPCPYRVAKRLARSRTRVLLRLEQHLGVASEATDES